MSQIWSLLNIATCEGCLACTMVTKWSWGLLSRANPSLCTYFLHLYSLPLCPFFLFISLSHYSLFAFPFFSVPCSYEWLSSLSQYCLLFSWAHPLPRPMIFWTNFVHLLLLFASPLHPLTIPQTDFLHLLLLCTQHSSPLILIIIFYNGLYWTILFFASFPLLPCTLSMVYILSPWISQFVCCINRCLLGVNQTSKTQISGSDKCSRYKTSAIGMTVFLSCAFRSSALFC